jgi:glycerate kinase
VVHPSDAGRDPPEGDGSLAVVIAPDSVKGSISSVEVAHALATGWARGRPGDHIVLAPLADGGEGTLLAVEASGGWEWQATEVADPLGRPVVARWLRSDDGHTAVLEMAEASGLKRLQAGERDPIRATTLGTGQLILAAAVRGLDRIILGIGGSATTDGGRGLIQGLGGQVGDEAGSDPVDLSGLAPSLRRIRLDVACDVSNPLLGPEGAAAIYGPQKGATPEEVRELDAALARWADRLEAATGRRVRDMPGAGAAGGLGFALLCLADRFASFALRPGVELVMEATAFDARLHDADVVLTGEGRIDEQTGYGKTALGVARRAQAAGVACIAVGGGVTLTGLEALAPLGAIVVPVVEAPMTVEAAIAAGVGPVERAGERIARLVTLGRRAVAAP